MSANIDNIISSRFYVGTLKRFANPKTSKYWADVINNVVVFDPEKQAEQLEKAKEKVDSVKSQEGNILVMMDKWLYREEIEQLCEQKNISYLNYNIPAGVFTNFSTLLSRVEYMNELERFINSEDFNKITKKERLDTQRKLNKLKIIYKGVRNITKKPDLVIIFDGMYLSSFVNEVEKDGIESIVLSSSDFDRYWKSWNIVFGNVNSYSSIEYFANYLLN